jgi:hypothetical protein
MRRYFNMLAVKALNSVPKLSRFAHRADRPNAASPSVAERRHAELLPLMMRAVSTVEA